MDYQFADEQEKELFDAVFKKMNAMREMAGNPPLTQEEALEFHKENMRKKAMMAQARQQSPDK